jgi:hypothetical protein
MVLLSLRGHDLPTAVAKIVEPKLTGVPRSNPVPRLIRSAQSAQGKPTSGNTLLITPFMHILDSDEAVHFFVDALYCKGLAGAVPIRKHTDGSRELGSLVVREDLRGCGLPICMIDAILFEENGPVHMVANAAYAPFYVRRGFRPVDPAAAPSAIRFNYRVGRLASVITFLKGQKVRRLVILERTAE